MFVWAPVILFAIFTDTYWIDFLAWFVPVIAMSPIVFTAALPGLTAIREEGWILGTAIFLVAMSFVGSFVYYVYFVIWWFFYDTGTSGMDLTI